MVFRVVKNLDTNLNNKLATWSKSSNSKFNPKTQAGQVTRFATCARRNAGVVACYRPLRASHVLLGGRLWTAKLVRWRANKHKRQFAGRGAVFNFAAKFADWIDQMRQSWKLGAAEKRRQLVSETECRCPIGIRNLEYLTETKRKFRPKEVKYTKLCNYSVSFCSVYLCSETINSRHSSMKIIISFFKISQALVEHVHVSICSSGLNPISTSFG